MVLNFLKNLSKPLALKRNIFAVEIDFLDILNLLLLGLSEGRLDLGSEACGDLVLFLLATLHFELEAAEADKGVNLANFFLVDNCFERIFERGDFLVNDLGAQKEIESLGPFFHFDEIGCLHGFDVSLHFVF